MSSPRAIPGAVPQPHTPTSSRSNSQHSIVRPALDAHSRSNSHTSTGRLSMSFDADGIPHFDAPASPLRSASRSLRSARSGSSFGARSLDGSTRGGDGGELDLDGAALGLDKHEAERVLRLQEEEQEAATLGLIRRLEALNTERASIQAALQSATPHDGIAARLLRSPRSASHLNIAQSSSPTSAADLGGALQHTSLQAQQAHGSAALPPLLEGTTSVASGPRTPRTPEATLHMQRSSTFGPAFVQSPSSPYFPSMPHAAPAFPRAAVGDQARQIAENADSLAAQVEELVNTSRSFTHVWEYADAMRDECIRLRSLLGLPTTIAPLPVPHPRTTTRTRTDSVASAASSTRARGRTITSPMRLDPPPLGASSPGVPAVRKLRVTDSGELAPVRRDPSQDAAQQEDAEEMDEGLE